MTPQRLALIRARLQARLKAQGISSFTRFHDRELATNPNGPGMQLLIDLTTVNHSAFFREPAPLRALAEHLAASIRGRAPSAGPIRVWSAGCAAGQEPYSLVMLISELVPGVTPDRFEVWASDIALGMVRAGARAIYETRELEGLPPDRLRRSFLRGRGARAGTCRVVPEIRRHVTFQQFDLRRAEWPLAGDFDAILCRNVMIYFSESERLTLLDRLAGRLRPGGWLVVGSCEILPDRPGALRKIAPSIFRRVPS